MRHRWLSRERLEKTMSAKGAAMSPKCIPDNRPVRFEFFHHTAKKVCIAGSFNSPMIGGVVTSTVMELIVYPAIFYLWRSRRFKVATTNDSNHERAEVLCPTTMQAT